MPAASGRTAAAIVSVPGEAGERVSSWVPPPAFVEPERNAQMAFVTLAKTSLNWTCPETNSAPVGITKAKLSRSSGLLSVILPETVYANVKGEGG